MPTQTDGGARTSRRQPALALLVSTLRPDRGRLALLVVVLLAGTLLPLAGPLLLGRVATARSAAARPAI